MSDMKLSYPDQAFVAWLPKTTLLWNLGLLE